MKVLHNMLLEVSITAIAGLWESSWGILIEHTYEKWERREQFVPPEIDNIFFCFSFLSKHEKVSRDTEVK